MGKKRVTKAKSGQKSVFSYVKGSQSGFDSKIVKGIGLLLFVWWLCDLLIAFFLYPDAKIDVLWFCNVSLLLFSLGIFFRLPSLLIAVFSYALFIQPIWLLDFFSRVFFGSDLVGDTAFIFQEGFLLIDYLNMFSHFILLPLGLLTLLLVAKKGRYTHLVAIAYAVVLLPLSRILSDQSYNLNCAFRSCGRSPSFGLEGIAYFFSFLLMIILIGLLLSWVVSKGIDRFISSKRKEVIVKRILYGISAYFAFSLVVFFFGFLKFLGLGI